MKRSTIQRGTLALTINLTLAWLALGCNGAASSDREITSEEVLARASAAYRSLGPFRGEMTITVNTPGEQPTERAVTYGVGEESVFVDAGFQRIVAAGGRIVATQINVEDKYVSAPFTGDFAAALASIGGGQLQIPDLPPIVLRQASDPAAWIDAFRMKALGPVALASEVIETTRDEKAIHRLELTADNGTVRADFDVDGGLLVAMDLEATPAGAPATMRIQALARFSTVAVDDLGELVTVNTGDRVAVMDLQALNAEQIEVGAKVPPHVLESIRGVRVDLGELRDRVVVLDFWASWCGPCWGALEQLEEVVAWAESSGLPVTVWAVNTAEGLDDPAAQRDKVSSLWHERGFAMDSLIDPGGRLFSSIGAPGLPSTVVITPDGSLASVHQGVLADSLATLRPEIESLLASRR